MDRSTLLMLVGAPGSGKSTLAQLLIRHSSARIISLNNEREKYPDCPERILIHQVRSLVRKAVIGGENIIFDAVHPTRASRQLFVSRHGDSRPPHVRMVAVTLMTPLEECLRRMAKRISPLRSHQTCTPEIATSFWYCINEMRPRRDEGFDEVVTLDGTLPPEQWLDSLRHVLPPRTILA